MAKEEKKSEGLSTHGFHTICVFGGSRLGNDNEFVSVATDLGKIIAARNLNLVYGGGIRGLRGCVATAAFVKGSKVLGILHKDLADRSITTTVGAQLQVSSMHERYGLMLHNAEAFIALPGGAETLEGISSIVYWAKLNFHRKPLGLLNINGFYDGLISFLDHAVEQNFISQATRQTIKSASNIDQLIDELQNCVLEADITMRPIGWQPPDSNKTPDRSNTQKPDTTLRL